MTKIRVRETLAEARVSSACYFGRQLIYISMIRRDSMKMNSINSSILLSSPLMLYKDNGSYQLLQGSKQLSAMVSRLKLGKDSFIHSVVYPNNNRMDNVFMYRTEDYYDKLYAKLMERYDLPLLKEWIVQLDDVLKRRNLIRTSDVEVYEDIDNHLAGTAFCLIEEGLTQEVFDGILSSLIRFNKIKLLEPQEMSNYQPLDFSSIDDFYIKYGEQILGDVIGKIKPVIEEPKTYLENVVLKEKTLFPPQAYVANGASRTLDRYKSVFMLETMGAGKTLQSFAVAEDYHVRKYLRRYPKATREEAIENVKYRIIVMSPGHILEKWKKEIEREIPYSQVEILDSFEKVLSLSKERGKEPKGKCFYIISKDFSKLGYVSYPLVKKSSKRLEKYYQCRVCGAESTSHESVCHRCSGQMEVKFDGLREGAICPHCNTVLKTNDGPMELSDFENRTNGNSHCRTCGEELWGPLVQKETLDKIPWKKYKMYRNASQKGTKTVWVHDDLVHVYSYESEGLFVESKVNPIRKYPPSLFIRKKLGKNFFNACIIDEAHQYKSGSSAQGSAMFDIVRSSRKVIALTGTIAGGYANDVFYLFWRTKSWLMKKMGWDYDDVISFAERYGTVEKKFQKGEERYNEMSRGRAIGSPRVKPGISPLIYTDYMFEDTVYLDIGDLSSFMPNYYEYIRLVELDDETDAVYETLKDDFMSVIRDKDGGHKLASSMLQTLLSYPDKPYGYKSLLHPESGEEAVYIPDCELLDGETLNKEEELLEIIEKELEEDRPCFVYCEFTGSGEKNVTGRLKKLIENRFGLHNEVAILDSSGPSSREREAYIHKKASEGVKVFITNPRLTETGLDFIFEVEAVQYNYPTIIFYQLGTNLTTMWQSSRRSYRLIQTKECRTYYIAYQGTLQQSVLELMGEKKMATSILQGKFSASALTTDNDLDVRYRLMKELDNNIKATSINTVEAHFKKMNEEEQNREIPEADRLFLEEMRRKRQEMLKQKKLEQEKAIEDALDAAIEVFDLFLLGSEEADNIEVNDVPSVMDVSSFSESEEAEEEEFFDIGYDLKSGQFKLF